MAGLAFRGPVRAIHGLCSALVAAGAEVEVCTTTVNGDGDTPGGLARHDGVAIRYFPCRFSRRIYYSPPMAAYLREHLGGFDLVHIHSAWLWPGMVAARQSRRLGVPYVFAPRGMLTGELIRQRNPWAKRLWLAVWGRRILAGAAAIAVASEVEERELKDLGLDLAPTWRLPNGLSESDFTLAEQARQLERGEHGLYLGRLAPGKGLENLLDACARVPGLRLRIVGGGDLGLENRLTRRCAQLGIADRVEIVPMVSGERVWNCLARARFLAMPSRFESFSMSVLEALACATPVVVGSKVGLAQAVNRGGCGIVCDPDPLALAEAMTTLRRDPGTAEAMGRRGFELARSEFGNAMIAERLLALYRGLVKRG